LVYGGQTPLVVVIVLGIRLLLLLVAFHSIVIPLKAIGLNLLSAGAAFGVQPSSSRRAGSRTSRASGPTSSRPRRRP